MFAQYSPLFTSGLMSDQPVSSRTPSPARRFRRTKHHDSLPVTVKSSNTSSFYEGVLSARPDSSADGFLFTLAPHRRQVDDGRSFLSLDLAESQSMRSMSLRRKDTVTTKASAFLGKSEPTSPMSPHTSKRVPWAPQLPSISSAISATSVAPSLRRSSRETLRLPSPKPAPSINLPEPPASDPAVISPTSPRAPSRKHRPSNLVITLSACFMEAGPSSSSPPSFTLQHRPSRSAPSIMSPTLPSPGDDSYILFSPSSPGAARLSFPFPSPPSSSSKTSFQESAAPLPSPTPLRPSLSTRSTATVNTRNRNRSAALAALEGRGPRSLSSVREDHQRSRPRNFMSMSDDEDEDEDADVEMELMSVLNEEEGLVIPQPAKSVRSSKRSSVKRGRTPTPRDEKTNESGSVSSASKAHAGALTSSSTPSSKRSRRSTVESLFSPLTNFIDFREDADGRGWRSFVEITS